MKRYVSPAIMVGPQGETAQSDPTVLGGSGNILHLNKQDSFRFQYVPQIWLDTAPTAFPSTALYIISNRCAVYIKIPHPAVST